MENWVKHEGGPDAVMPVSGDTLVQTKKYGFMATTPQPANKIYWGAKFEYRIYTDPKDAEIKRLHEAAKKALVQDYQRRKTMTEEKRKALEAAVQPLMQYLAENHHPHTTVIVTSENAELVEGLATAGRTTI